MTKKIKIYILRKDGRIQKYSINRRNLKRYEKVSFRKKEKRWVWIRRELKIQMEKEKLEKKPKEPKLREFKKPVEMFRQTWHVKLIYDKRGKKGRHDLLIELKLTTVSKEPLDEHDIKEMFDEHLEPIVNAITNEGLPFEWTKIEVGLEDEETVEAYEESIEASVISYSHNIHKALKRWRW